MRTEKEIYEVWIDLKHKIATFHSEPGYRKKEFTKRREYLKYLQQLSMKHYRFK